LTERGLYLTQMARTERPNIGQESFVRSFQRSDVAHELVALFVGSPDMEALATSVVVHDGEF